MKGHFKILRYMLKENGTFMKKCKIIHFISSQSLPQVVLGMLEITKYKIPLPHTTYFPHHQFYCRFTTTLTSKPR